VAISVTIEGRRVHARGGVQVVRNGLGDRTMQPSPAVLMAAEGLQNEEIAERLSISVQIVTKWRKRFHAERFIGLDERPRAGRPLTKHATDAKTRP